jgi:hypothetical protein
MIRTQSSVDDEKRFNKKQQEETEDDDADEKGFHSIFKLKMTSGVSSVIVLGERSFFSLFSFKNQKKRLE